MVLGKLLFVFPLLEIQKVIKMADTKQMGSGTPELDIISKLFLYYINKVTILVSIGVLEVKLISSRCYKVKMHADPQILSLILNSV